MMQIKELLSVPLEILNHTDSCSREHNTTICSILQITSSIETTESMSPLQSQIAIWCLTHSPIELKAIWSARLNLTEEWNDAACLITLLQGASTKLIITDILSKAIVSVSSIVFEAHLLTVTLSIGLLTRLSCSFLVHKILPLEDGLVLTSGRDQVLLPVRVP